MENVRPPGWRNPPPAGRYSLVVVGGGPAGLVAASAAATMGAKVALVERALLGGGCLNVGCIPSKTIIRTSRLYAEMRNAEHYGAQIPANIHVDFADWNRRAVGGRHQAACQKGGDRHGRATRHAVDSRPGRSRLYDQ